MPSDDDDAMQPDVWTTPQLANKFICANGKNSSVKNHNL
jgi:hypothetical protein